jgi:hypothetical protein
MIPIGESVVMRTRERELRTVAERERRRSESRRVTGSRETSPPRRPIER